MSMKNNIMTMALLKNGLPLPQEKTIMLKPMDTHIMFLNLKKTLSDGELIPIKLFFENNYSIETTLHVKPITSKQNTSCQ